MLTRRELLTWAALFLRRLRAAGRHGLRERRSGLGALREHLREARRSSGVALDRTGVVGILGQPGPLPRASGRRVPAAGGAQPARHSAGAGGLHRRHRRGTRIAPAHRLDRQPHRHTGRGPRDAGAAAADAGRVSFSHSRQSRVPDVVLSSARTRRARRRASIVVVVVATRGGRVHGGAAREGRVHRADFSRGRTLDSDQPDVRARIDPASDRRVSAARAR